MGHYSKTMFWLFRDFVFTRPPAYTWPVDVLTRVIFTCLVRRVVPDCFPSRTSGHAKFSRFVAQFKIWPCDSSVRFEDGHVTA